MTGLQIAAIVFFVLAFFALVISVVLFFNLDIVRVIGDLSGLTAKKQIEQIRNQTMNISYGAHKRVQSNHNAVIDNMLENSPSRMSEPLAKESKHSKRRSANAPGGSAAQINEQKEFKATPSSGTVSLDSINNTDMLNTGRTGRLKKRSQSKSEAATDVLNSDEMPTDILNDPTETPTDVLDDNVPTDILYSESEAETGVLSDTAEPQDKVIDETEAPTGVLNSDDEPDSEAPTGVLNSDDELDSEEPTGVLNNDDEEFDSEEPTGVLSEVYEQGTSVLSDDALGTTVLSNGQETSNQGFTVTSDETVINTEEVIE